MPLLPYLILSILRVSVRLMVELKTRNLLEAFLGDDGREIAEALVGLRHEFDASMQEEEAFGIDFLIAEMEATDGELPSCLQACGTIVFSKRISAPNTLLWRVLSLTDGAFRMDSVRFKDTIRGRFGHELDEISRVIVILVDNDSQFGWNEEERAFLGSMRYWLL